MSHPTAPFMTAPHKRMRYFSFKALLFAALSLSFSLYGFAKNAYWTEFGNKPVYVQQSNGGTKQTLKFIDFKDNMLVAQMTIDGNVGEMSLPVSESMVNTLSFNVSEMQKANKLIRDGNDAGAVTVLRPVVYPLVKFSRVPELFTQLHSPIRTLISSLISAGELTEADDLLSRIPLDKVDIKYSQLAIELMHGYFAKENYEAAARIARELPKSGDYTSNISQVVSAADALRGAGEYEAVIPLYREIEGSVPEEIRKNVRMWLAYSLVLADRVDEASPMIDSMQEPDAKDRLFSLYKLLQGSREHRNKNYGDALDALTRGFVRAQTSYAWVPEMLYLIGDCYARSEDSVAARNVWSEITVLYPESPWSKRAAESLSKLPKPKPTPAVN
jgi:thioredoxin-like negative regulator of GroEL